MKSGKRIKLTVSNPFPIFPPTYGGQLRVYNLYLQLSKWFDVDVVVYSNPGGRTLKRQLAEGFYEKRVPKTLEHCRKEAGLIEETGVPLTDIALLKYHQHTPEYLDVLKNSCMDSEVVVCSHPYTFNAVKAVAKGRIWYDAHNVEYLLKKDILPEGSYKEELLELISEVERECCNRSELILACSQEDKDRLCELYNQDKDKVVIVPNGANVSEIDFLLPDERMKTKVKEAVWNKSAIFVGSYHGPNLIAVDYILKMAIELPEVRFIIVGSSGKWLDNSPVPENILITGIVDEKDKDELLKSSDLALNPMTYGSGTNLKILEYFAFGVPVISTPVGVRGLGLNSGQHALVCDIDHFADTIRKLLAFDNTAKEKLVKAARKFVEESFDWKSIAHGLIGELSQRAVFPDLDDNDYKLREVKYNINPDTPNNLALKRIASRSVYIWGAGSAGKNTLKLLQNENICLSGFIDSDPKKCGRFVDDVEVFKPTFVADKKGNDRPFIVVASTYAEEIEKLLDCMGYKSGDDYLVQDINSPYLCLY